MARTTSKRVLMVAFHYPPEHSSSGVLRTLKFSKYLPDYRWQPTILTVRENCYDQTDNALLQQIPPSVRVCRTSAFDTKKVFSIRGKYLRITTIPDRFVAWLPFAVSAGLRLIRIERIDAIYSTSPMATAHLIASALKSLTKIPWIADFRDPWTEPALIANRRAPLFRLECFLERRVIQQADRLVFTTEQLREELVSRYPDVDRRKAVVIPNGYDEEDFPDLSRVRPDPLPIRIMHTGLVDASYRSPRGFLEALAHLLKNGDILADQVHVEFMGGGEYLRSADFRSQLENLGLERVVSIAGRVSYAECLQRQARSHILLLLQCGSDTRALIPAKAFEYLRVGRPILAIVPPGASSELFQRTGGAKVADPNDPAAICNALLELLVNARAGNWSSDARPAALQSYTRRALTGRLASELTQLCAASSHRTR